MKNYSKITFAILLISALASCGKKTAEEKSGTTTDTLQVVEKVDSVAAPAGSASTK